MSNKRLRFGITVRCIIHHPDGLRHDCVACELPAAHRDMYLSQGNAAFPRKGEPLISPSISPSVSPFSLCDLQSASVFPRPVTLGSPLRGLRPNTVTASLYPSLSEPFEPLISNFSSISQPWRAPTKCKEAKASWKTTGETLPRKEQSDVFHLNP